MNFLPSKPVDPARENTSASLTTALRERTRELHQRAERSGIVSDILHGRATCDGYVLLLRNLLPAYEAMEDALAALRLPPGPSAIAWKQIFRSAAIRSDLAALAGSGWESAVPVLTAGAGYRDRIRLVAEDYPRLLGHAYVRYFGDLNGGQILKKLLGQSLRLAPSALAFYDFPGISDVRDFKARLRTAFDRAIVEPEEIAAAADDAADAFQLNIRVSEAVQAASGVPFPDPDSAPP